MSIVTTAMTRTGCGCGTSGGTGSCGCGVPSCSTCDDQGFVRPRFFAGQLLTEDDLELLGSYVASKNRLHNRFFMGDGVVAGLDVLCQPCDPGKVRILPGYALDCCGNDIVVPCEEIVDVLALARSLGGALTRYGCADPCAREKDSGGTTTPPRDDTVDHVPAAAERRESDGPPALERPQRYCLYLRYCESEAEPTTPYASTDPCGTSVCEATRIREGYRFELSCREDHSPPPDIFSVFTSCVGDLVQTNRAVSEVLFLQGLAIAMEPALVTAKRTADIPWTSQHVSELNSAVSDLASWNLDSSPMDRSKLLRGATFTQRVNGLYLRYQHTTATSPGFVDMTPAQTEVGAATVHLESGLGSVSELTGPEAAWVTSVHDIGRELTSLGSGPTTPLMRLLAQGQSWTRDAQNAYVAALEEVREVLLDHMVPGSPSTDCKLRTDVISVELPPVRGGLSDPALTEVELVLDGVDRLVAALLRYWMDCLCRALNPPVPACDDERVLLACLEIDQCEVDGICMTERKWVMTGPNMRYWLPPLRLLGDLLEQACCTVRGNLMEAQSFEALLGSFGFQVRRASASDGLGQVKSNVSFSPTYAMASVGRAYKVDHTRNFAELPQATINMAELAGTRMRVIQPEAFRTVETIDLPDEPALEREELRKYVDARVTERVDERTTEIVRTRLASEGTAVVSDAARAYFEERGAELVQPIVREAAEASVQPAVEAAEAVLDERRGELLTAAREAGAAEASERIGSEVAARFDRLVSERAYTLVSEALATDEGRALLLAAVEPRLSEVSTTIETVGGETETARSTLNSLNGRVGAMVATNNRLKALLDEQDSRIRELESRLGGTDG